MPDPHRIQGELLPLLSHPRYTSLLAHRNQFRNPKSSPETPASIAAATAAAIFKNNPLLDPVEVVELTGYTELYRAHDGGSGIHTASTLGRSWFERPIAEEIWKATAKSTGPARQREYMELLRTANFVLPEWNGMLYLACMAVPAGSRVVVVRGRGNWKAMRTPVGKSRPGGAPGIGSQADVLDHLKMMPIPGTMQCIVPLFNDNWIVPVNPGSGRWPFLT
jgi:hypothetical protein